MAFYTREIFLSLRTRDIQIYPYGGIKSVTAAKIMLNNDHVFALDAAYSQIQWKRQLFRVNEKA